MNIGKRIEWPTVGLLALCYGGWAVAGFVVHPLAPLAAFAVMAVLAGFHTSLQHEALHGHPSRNAGLNELLVSLPLCVFYPYARFRQLHLKHHHDERLTDPYDDPESWYRDRVRHARLAGPLRWLLAVNNTLAGRFVLGPALMIVSFYHDEFDRFRRGERGVRQAWARHAAGLAALAFLLAAMGIHPAAYLAVAYAGMSIISIRTYCEHRWHDDPDGRTLIVERGGVLGFLFLNNHLHFVHHKRPHAPWYALPRLYRSDRAAWQRMNGGYVVRDYWQIMRAFAFHAKEPVVHPVWTSADRARPLPGAAFQPPIHQAGPQVAAPAVAPAAPDQD